MLRHGDIVEGGGNHIVGGFLCPSVIAGYEGGLYDLAVLIVRKADGAVVAPIPAFVGDDGLYRAVSHDQFQLRQQFGFGSVLVF